jgi:hypothetical protein
MSTVLQVASSPATGNAISATTTNVGGVYHNQFAYVVATFNGNSLSPTVADSQSNTWTLIGHQDAGSTALSTVYVWYSMLGNAWGASDNVTVNRGASGDINIRVSVVPLGTGLDAATPVTATNTGTAVATAALSIASLSIVVQEVVGQTSGVTVTPGTGFTAEADIASTGASSNRFMHGQYDDAGTSGSVTPALTLSAAQQWGSVAFAVACSAAAPVVELVAHQAVANEPSGVVNLPPVPVGTWISVHATMNGTITPTIADTQGQTWTAFTPVQPAGTALTTGAVWVTKLTSGWSQGGTTDTLTVTTGGSHALAFSVMSVKAGLSLDGVAVAATAPSGSSAPATASLTIHAGSVVMCLIVAQSSGVTLTAGSGFTDLSDFGTTGASSNRYLHGEYDAAGTAGSVTPSGTLSSSQQWGMIAYAVATSAIPNTGQPWMAGTVCW